MASSVLGMIKEEVTCPVCLELLKDPVSANCNHIFCRACITLNYESSKGKEDEGVCPVCRECYLFENLRPNWHVANIVERLKEFKSSPEEEQKVNVCVQHGEKLQLFCEKDMVAICWLCERSQDHRGHQTALIEENYFPSSVKLYVDTGIHTLAPFVGGLPSYPVRAGVKSQNIGIWPTPETVATCTRPASVCTRWDPQDGRSGHTRHP